MTNRARLIAAIEERASPLLRADIDHTLEVWADDPDSGGGDKADAFWSVCMIASDNSERRLVRECDDIMIAAGYLTPRRGAAVFLGRDRSPIRKGVRYDCMNAWHTWIEQ